jgi:hypothetical protein
MLLQNSRQRTRLRLMVLGFFFVPSIMHDRVLKVLFHPNIKKKKIILYLIDEL